MKQVYFRAAGAAQTRRAAVLGGLLLLLALLPWAARAQCNFSAAVRNQTVTLAPDGTATVLASGFDNGSTSACGPLTFTMQDQGSVSGSVGEGGTLTLTAPGGALFSSVRFASYGTPGGSAGSYTLGGCHATNSVSVVSPLLVGRSSGSIGANNGTFGDPCNGTVKTLAVTARYNQPGGPFAAQFGYTCAEVGSYTVNVRVTDASGNTSTLPVTLTLLAPPAPTLTGLSPSPAIVGQTITATGTNLSGSTSLLVNGVAATINGLTATGFTFVVPAGAASSGNVVVAAPCGQPASRPFAVQASISSFSPTSGPGNTLVTVTGTNLAGATAVTLNGTAAAIQGNSGTSLTLRVPFGASTGLIAITTPGGTVTTSALSPASFTVLPAPYAMGFAPPAAAAGTSVTLTGGNLAGLTALVVNGVDATASITGNTGTSLTFVVPAGASDYQNVALTGPAGSSNSSSAFVVQLRATAFSPTANARAALRTALVSATFSEPVVAGAASELKVYSAQAGGRKAGTYAASGSTLTFDPTLDFKPGETVLTTVPGAVRSAGGLLLGQSKVFQFTTAVGGTGTGNFQPGTTVAVGSRPVDVAMADVDGDGDLDMLAANADSYTVSVRFNTGTGTFGSGSEIYLNGMVQGLAVGDVDGDGDLDLLASTPGNYTTALCLNDGAGNFQYVQDIYAIDNYGNYQQPSGVTLADVDGDGDLDLLAATSGDVVSISLNGGDASGSNTGSFSGGGSAAVTAGAFNLAVADVDGDGAPDLLAASRYSNTVSVRLNDGAGSFGGSQEVAVGSGSDFVSANDVDGDGDLDLLTANAGTSTVSVRLNNGTGIFGGSQEVAVGPGPLRVLLADVDADTDLDLLAANSNGTVSLRLNNGTGTFAGGRDLTALYSTGALALADVDGDSDLDLLAPTNYSTMGVFLNLPPPAVLTSLSPTSGEVGTSVTITGLRLTGATVVTFNGVSAPGFVVNSPTSITVAVPAGATTGNVVVTTAGGPSNGLPFTVLVPVIASLNPTSGLVGTSVEIIGSYFSATTLVRFNGTVAPGFVVNSPTSITVSVPAGASTGTVLVTTPSGTSNGVLFTVLAPVIASLNPNSGFVGSSTEIIGSNLATATQVRFNGVSAPGFVVNSNTSITVTVPVGTTTGNVLVTTPSGTSNGVLFTVPVPVLSTFTPAFAPAGATVAVTGTTLGGLTALMVNGVAVPLANISNNTGTGFSFVVPAGGSNFQGVSVSNFAGTGSSAAFSLRLLATPTAPLRNAGTAATAGSAVALTFSEAVTLPATSTATTGLKVYSAQVGGRKAGTVTGSGTTSVRFVSSATGSRASFMPGEVVSVTVPPTVLGAGGLAARKQVYQFTAAVGATGTGKFQAGTDPSVSASPVVVALADVDGDGDLDVLTGSSSTTAVSVRLNGGSATAVNTGTFSNGSSTGVGLATGLAVGDLNGDGNLDYVLSTTGNTLVTRLNNAGTGTFTTGQTLSYGVNYRGVALGDVDGDGDLDIVGATANGLSVSLNGSSSAGTNTGTFPTSFSSSLAISGGGRGIALADVDADGDLDVLIGNATNGTVHVRLNGGDASGSNTGIFNFGSDVSVGTAGSVGYSVAVGDVDGDGDLDLLAANSTTTGLVSVRLNNGTGTFSGTQNVAVGSTPRSVVLGDVDGDGDLDFVTANNGAASASVRYNDGLGTFSGSTNVAVGSTPSGIALGDVDGDGDLDFVTANTAATGTVSVRFNVPQPAITSLSAAAELPGMPVIITGAGFAAGSTVTFGGVSAGSVTLSSATSLTAVVPAGAAVGSSAIVVTTGGTPSATSPAFTVLKVYDATTSTCPATTPYAATGDGKWHYLLATTGEVVAALQDTRAALGSVSVSYQVTGTAAAVRQDGRGRKYLDRNFALVASGGRFDGSTLNVRFYGLTAEFDRLQAADPAVTYAGLKATQYSGTNEDCDLANNDSSGGEFRALSAPASTPGGGIPWFVAELAVADHFSEFYLTNSSAPLPVELMTFTARAQGATVALSWTTASEKNSRAFEVERSLSGTSFERIATVAAAGTSSSTARSYALTDTKLPTGAVRLYYRLKQVDTDGSFRYSPVRTVALTGAAEGLALYPNPARGGAATLTGALPGTLVTVYDALGRAVTAAPADATGTAALALPAGLPTGVYVVRSGSQALRLTVE